MNYFESCKQASDWIKYNCWIAVFDILGFKTLGKIINQDDMPEFDIRVAYEETLRNLKDSCEYYKPGSIHYCWYSDTFLMYTKDDSAESCMVIQSACKNFIEKCILTRMPIRGAISFGLLCHTKDNRSFIGNAFIEACEYAEDQKWVGLLITPSAVKKAESIGMYPARHDFVAKGIPLDKCNHENVLAYRFQNGAANFPCAFIPILRDMKSSASKDKDQCKYENTIKFIEDNYRYIRDLN